MTYAEFLEFYHAWNKAYSAPDRRPIYAWARENVVLPESCYAIGGPFRVDKSRYLMAPLDAAMSDLVREITVLAGVQTGKSLILDMLAAWLVCNRPGPCMWNFPTNEKASDYGARRAMPFLRNVKGIVWPQSRHDATKTEILFPSMWIALQGVDAEVNLQSHSVPYVLNDEVWEWPVGRLGHARARTTYFRWRSKIVNCSQAGDKGSDVDLAWEAGTQEEWMVPCPSCNRYQEMVWNYQRPDGSWGGFVWDTNETTKPGGRWKLDAVRPTIRYECVHCGFAIRDSPRERRRLNDLGRYESRNANAPADLRSYHWASWACDEVSWYSIVSEYLTAKEQAEIGNTTLIADWWKKRAAVTYDPDKHGQTIKLPETIVVGGEKKHWEKQDYIFLTVDVQLRSFWALVEAWSSTGESMVLWAGELGTWADVAAKQAEYDIPNVGVFIDCGFRRENAVNVSEVHLECLRHGNAVNGSWQCWWALRGSTLEKFTFSRQGGPDKGKPITLLYQWPSSKVRVAFGLKTEDGALQEVMKWQREHGRLAVVSEVSWAQNPISHITKARRDRMAKGEVRFVPKGAPWLAEFTRQMYSEQHVNRPDGSGHVRMIWQKIGNRPNHLWDCSKMQNVAAAMAGILGERVG